MTFQIIQFGFLKSIVVFNRVCIPDAMYGTVSYIWINFWGKCMVRIWV